MKSAHSRNRRLLARPGFWAGFVAFACLNAHQYALSQPVTGITGGGIDPSILQPKDIPDLQEQTQPLQPTGGKEKPKVETEGETDENFDAMEEQGPRFVLQEINISGVTVFPSKTLEEKFTPWIDREVGYKELLQIAAEITKLYKENGYVTSRAVLPPQDIENGTVTINVIEGKVGDIKIEGNKHLPDKYIAERLNHKPGEIFKLETLQKDMLNLSSDPLLDKVHATLKTGSKPGTSDLLLEADDHFPVHLMVGVDNGGRNGIGLWRTSYTLSHENVTGVGDSALLSASLATNTFGLYGQYRYPLNKKGWGLGANYSYTHVEAGETPVPVTVDGTIDKRSITGESHRVSIFTDFPIYRDLVTRRWDVTGNISLNFTDSMTYLDKHSLKEVEYELKELNPANRVEFFPILRTLVSQVQAVEQDKTGRWLLSGSMTNGMVALGGNDAFIKFNGNITRVQALPFGVIGLFKAEGQFTPNRLPFAEKMQIGGANSVRGYAEGHLISDAGYLLSAELRYPLNFLPKKLRSQWQGLIFAEYGEVFACSSSAEGTPGGKPGELFGYGVGLRGQLTKYLNARLDLGMATTRNEQQPDFRAHFSLNSPLF